MRLFQSSLNFPRRGGGITCRRAVDLVVLAMATLVWTVPAGTAANAARRSPWVATWGAGMVATTPGGAPDLSGKTLREIVHTSVGGSRVRVWLSNRFGSSPLHIGAVHIAVSAGVSAGANPDGIADESGVAAGTDRTLTFNQSDSVVILPGAEVVSDPVALDVPELSSLAVSMYFPDRTTATTEHTDAQQTSYAATGNLVDAANLAGKDWPQRHWYVLSGVDVDAPGDSAVIAMGASIVDGYHSTWNDNHRWPDDLATRLAADANTRKAGVLGVVDVGIGGNRVLLDGYGPSASSRFNRDVLARSGVRYLIVLEGTNDIGRFAVDHQPYGDFAQRLESGLAQLAMQAHQHGILVFGATLTPYKDCFYYSAAGDEVRQEVNQWIRTSGVLDGVVDFDKATRDPQNPLRYLPRYDSGDHLHPNDAGYQAMANAIDLSMFTKTASAHAVGQGTSSR